MKFVKRYLIPRLLQYFLVTFLGLTMAFVLPRLMPADPVEQLITQMQAVGAGVSPEHREEMMRTLRQLYGLEGTLWQQYVIFWKRLLSADFGPSLFQYPVPVSRIIAQSLPWTLGLLFTTTAISWILGNLIGGLAGYFHYKKWPKLLDGAAMLLRPIPYYIVAMLVLIFLAYIFPIFPLAGGIGIGVSVAFNLEAIKSLLRHAALPALTLVIVGWVGNFQAMKLIVQTVRSEDYVSYAQFAGVKDGIIAFRYVIRNAMLPQLTQLGLSFGQIFAGALITEMVFAYPGIGWILYQAVLRADYNLIMGILCISIIAITTSILVLDLVYPLFDPRVRYR